MAQENMEKPVKWPQGYKVEYNQIRAAAAMILSGRLLAIDPGSTSPGYALVEAGVIVKSGVIKIPKLIIYDRLKYLHRALQELAPSVDVLAIEQIRGAGGFSHYFLHWSVGTSIAAVQAPITIECPTNIWKALAKTDPNYLKTDENDARQIAESIVLLAKQLGGVQ